MTDLRHWDVGANVAVSYERYLVPAVFRPWALDLVAAAVPRAGERVLDLACGTGIVARLAAPAVGLAGRITGVDSNEQMLAVARSLPDSQGITWRVGTATALPFADQTFDLVLCQQGLPFFPDRAAALREMARVLVPGGRVALTVWRSLRHNPTFAALVEAVDRYCGAQATATVRLSFTLGEAPELIGLLAQAGFSAIVARPVAKTLRFASPEAFVLQYGAGSPLAAAVAQLDPQTRAALAAEVRVVVDAYADDRGLLVPMEAHMMVAQRALRPVDPGR